MRVRRVDRRRLRPAYWIRLPKGTVGLAYVATSRPERATWVACGGVNGVLLNGALTRRRKRSERVERVARQVERERDRRAGAAQLQCLQGALELRTGRRLHLRQSQETAQNVAEAVRGLFVASLGTEHAADAAVDICGGREQRDGGEA